MSASTAVREHQSTAPTVRAVGNLDGAAMSKPSCAPPCVTDWSASERRLAGAGAADSVPASDVVLASWPEVGLAEGPAPTPSQAPLDESPDYSMMDTSTVSVSLPCSIGLLACLEAAATSERASCSPRVSTSEATTARGSAVAHAATDTSALPAPISSTLGRSSPVPPNKPADPEPDQLCDRSGWHANTLQLHT